MTWRDEIGQLRQDGEDLHVTCSGIISLVGWRMVVWITLDSGPEIITKRLLLQTLSHLKCDNQRLRRENKGLVRVVAHMVRWYRPSRKVSKIVKRLETNSRLPFGQARPLRAKSCGDLLGQLTVSRELEDRPPPPAMKDKIVEAKPRSNKRKDWKNSKVDLVSKVETNHINGINEKLLYKTDLTSSRPQLSEADRNKSKQDLADIQAIIKLQRPNSTESKSYERIKSPNSLDFQ